MFLKNRNISSKIKKSKVTDYAALKLWQQNKTITFILSSSLRSLKHWYEGFRGSVVDVWRDWVWGCWSLVQESPESLPRRRINNNGGYHWKTPSIQVSLLWYFHWYLSDLHGIWSSNPEKKTATVEPYATFGQSYWRATEKFGRPSITFEPDLSPKVNKDGHVAFIFPGYLLQTPYQSDQY